MHPLSSLSFLFLILTLQIQSHRSEHSLCLQMLWGRWTWIIDTHTPDDQVISLPGHVTVTWYCWGGRISLCRQEWYVGGGPGRRGGSLVVADLQTHHTTLFLTAEFALMCLQWGGGKGIQGAKGEMRIIVVMEKERRERKRKEQVRVYKLKWGAFKKECQAANQRIVSCSVRIYVRWWEWN